MQARIMHIIKIGSAGILLYFKIGVKLNACDGFSEEKL